jgi:hypothetical protein
MTEQVSGITDVTYNLIIVIYHALQGAENYAVYAKDAEAAGEGEIAQFLNQLKNGYAPKGLRNCCEAMVELKLSYS